MASFERGRALVVGVGAYSDPRWEVPVAARDARAIREALVAHGGYGPGSAEALLDGAASKAGVLAALRRLADRCDPESVALIAFTCHGALGTDGLYYLATSEARFAGEQVAAGTGLHVAELARALRDIAARQLLLVVNACASGEILARTPSEALRPDAGPSGLMLPDRAADELLATGEGRAVITASRADQRSYFNRGDAHSYFGQALIDALAGGLDGSPRRFIGLNELYESVYRRVRNVTLRRLGAAQEPVLTVVQSVGPFPVALNPGAAGDDPTVSPRPASDLPLRVVPRTTVQALGQGATAINAAPGSNVSVSSGGLINLGSNNRIGDISIGDVAQGDIFKGGDPGGAEPAAAPDPRRELPRLRERVAEARNVDEDARDEAAAKLDLAFKALGRGDSGKARQRVEEALAILRAMDNGYVRSITRKVEALRDIM